MENTVKNITKLATKLEDSGLNKQASIMDKLTKEFMTIKTAQYVGVQGYWVRNERCWANCYRQKRASLPNKSAQEIWQDCQNEYVDSINNPDSSWAKYANETTGVQKFAGTKIEKIAEGIISEEENYFRNTVDAKISKGTSYPVAVFEAVENRKAKYAESYIDLASKILVVAESAKSSGKEDLANEIAQQATDIMKEAGFWGDMWNGLKGEGQNYQRASSILEQNIQTIITNAEKIKASGQNGWNNRAQLAKNVRDVTGILGKQLGQAGIASRNIKAMANQFTQMVNPFSSQIEMAQDTQQLTQVIDQMVAAAQQFLPQVEAAEQADAQEAQQAQQTSTETPETQQEAQVEQQAEQKVEIGLQQVSQKLQELYQTAPGKGGTKGGIGMAMKYINQLIEQEAAEKTQPAMQQQNVPQSNVYDDGSGGQVVGAPLAANKTYFNLLK